MSAASTVDILLRLQGGSAFQRQARQAAGSLRQVGDSSQTMGKRARHGAVALGQLAGGATAAYAAFRLLKSSMTATEDLAKSTLKLSRITGMEAETSSAWVSTAKARGIETKGLETAMLRLTRNMKTARDGGKTAAEMFKQLGVSQATLKSGNAQDTMLKIADAMAGIKDPTEKSALAMQLFGKKGADLVPMLQDGSAELKKNQALAGKYGATLSTKTGKSIGEMLKQQRESKLAFEGMKLSIGQALMPVLMALAPVILKVVQALSPLLHNGALMKTVLIAAAAGFIAMQVASIAATAAAIGFNIAMLANPITWIVLGIIALIVGLTYLYFKFEGVRKVVNAVFGFLWTFIKRYWPYILGALTGGLGLAVVLVIKNFDKIKGAASSALNWIKTAFNNVVGFFRGLGSRIGSAASGAFNGLKNAFKAALNFIIRAWNNFRISVKLPGILGGGTIAIDTPNLPMLAAGGTITSAGAAIVGERGPEIISLPRGAQVAPLPAPSSVSTASLGGNRPIVSQVYLDGRMIAEAIGNTTADQLARR